MQRQSYSFIRLLFLLGLAFILTACGDFYKDTPAPEIPRERDFRIKSDNFVNNAYLLNSFRCFASSNIDGRKSGQLNSSPDIQWEDEPPGTTHFVLFMEESTRFDKLNNCEETNSCVHWQVYNINAEETKSIPEIRRVLSNELKIYKEQYIDKDTVGYIGPHGNTNITFIEIDGKQEIDDRRYYLAPCPELSADNMFTFSLYALSEPVPEETPNYLSSKTFETKYEEIILEKTKSNVRVRGQEFELISNTITADGQFITDKTLACGAEDNPNNDPGLDTLILPNGISPDLLLSNPPEAADSFFLFMQDVSSSANSRGNSTYFPPKPPTLGAGSFTINATNIQCDYYQCKHWGLSFLQFTAPGLENIPSGGPSDKTKNIVLSTLITNPHLYNRVVWAREEIKAGRTPNITEDDLSLTGEDIYGGEAGFGYYGPCAPKGSGARLYRITVMAMNKDFTDLIWKQKNTAFPVAPARSKALPVQHFISTLSEANFRYFFGGNSQEVKVYEDKGPNPTGAPVWSVELTDNKPKNANEFIWKLPVNPNTHTPFSRTDFYRTLMKIRSRGEELAVITAMGEDKFEALYGDNYIVAEADLSFYYEDQDSCELCRFCLIGHVPSDPFLDMWEQYGHGSPSGGNSSEDPIDIDKPWNPPPGP